MDQQGLAPLTRLRVEEADPPILLGSDDGGQRRMAEHGIDLHVVLCE
jgi:hypothetical protein